MVAHLTNFSFEFLYEIFTKDASRLLLYTMMQKTQIKGVLGGPIARNSLGTLSAISQAILVGMLSFFHSVHWDIFFR